jgi:hypothetical protein
VTHTTRRKFIEGSAAILGLPHVMPEGATGRETDLGPAGPAAMADPEPGELLYNGIRLPARWPPRYVSVPTREPMMTPYLHDIPDVIPIDLGRQLFVDDFLIEPTTLVRTYHGARYHDENPVLRADQPWESEVLRNEPAGPRAMVFSDGVWFDPAERVFKLWYMAGANRYTCYATSPDGIRWRKPELDVVAGTNIVSRLGRDSSIVWLDHFEKDPARRYKMLLYQRPEDSGTLSLFFSRDGIHWSDVVARSGPTRDRATAFFNPFRKKWVFSIKATTRREFGRRRQYWEHSDIVEGTRWSQGEPPLWVGADRLDRRREEYDVHPELYNLDAVAYESILLGLFVIWTGEGGGGRPKPNQLFVAFSRDGFHWHRPNREPFIPVSESATDWNYGNVQSAGGCCLVVEDRLRFYVSGRMGIPGSEKPGRCATGLATLRRDGFASLDSTGKKGEVTTRPVRFTGRRLFVNLAAADGELRVEVLDRDYKPIEPFTVENAVPLRADSTRTQVRWRSAADLAPLAGRPVRFRFHLTKGSLFSFWVAQDEKGASGGYVGAGGPGFTGPIDTVGSAV